MPSLPHRYEIIALMAMLTATVAFSIDAMLPALPSIAEELSPGRENLEQLVVASFVLGMGLGTLFTGPLSDRFGRKPVMLWGAGLYAVASMVGAFADSLEIMLAARLVQGLGAAGPRVVSLAILRDLYAGREMARTISFVMIIFTLVPAIAPLMGSYLIALAGWTSIFWAFAIFALISSIWMATRMSETLKSENRRPFRWDAIQSAMGEMYAHPVTRLSIPAQGFCMSSLFAMIMSVQPIYDQVFDRAESFPLWFGMAALISGVSGFINAKLVMRLGMRRLVTAALLTQIGFTSLMVIVLQVAPPAWQFPAFVFWQVTVFFQAGLMLGNMNAIAMEHMGHIAGVAASVIGAVATVIAVVLAAPVGMMFDGTPKPLALGILVFAICAFGLMRALARAELRVAPS